MLQAIRLLTSDDEDVALYGLITGPFTLALHLRHDHLHGAVTELGSTVTLERVTDD
jgi:uroporphyrinogen-III decarboxylase